MRPPTFLLKTNAFHAMTRQMPNAGVVRVHAPNRFFLNAAYPGRRFALPWAISFCPFGADGSGAGQRPEARGQRPEARGNSQTAGKLWCDPQKVSKDHDACRLASQDFSDDPKRIAPGPYDPGRGCAGLPGLKNQLIKALSLAVPSPEGWQTLCRWWEPPVLGT